MNGQEEEEVLGLKAEAQRVFLSVLREMLVAQAEGRTAKQYDA